MKPSEPPKPLGWSNAKWAAVIMGGIVALAAINYALNHEEIARKVAKENAERAAVDAASWAKAQRDSELMKLGRERGKADGIDVASHVAAGRMTKPSRVQIVALGISRAKDQNISDPAEQAVFLRRYEEVFKESYKETAEW